MRARRTRASWLALAGLLVFLALAVEAATKPCPVPQSDDTCNAPYGARAEDADGGCQAGNDTCPLKA